MLKVNRHKCYVSQSRKLQWSPEMELMLLLAPACVMRRGFMAMIEN
jgi:hypothetical protein